MKNKDIRNIPESLFKRRFTKREKEGVSDFLIEPSFQDLLEVVHMSKLGMLNSLATHMNSLACKVDRSYNIAKETMSNLIVQFQLPSVEQ